MHHDRWWQPASRCSSSFRLFLRAVDISKGFCSVGREHLCTAEDIKDVAKEHFGKAVGIAELCGSLRKAGDNALAKEVSDQNRARRFHAHPNRGLASKVGTALQRSCVDSVDPLEKNDPWRSVKLLPPRESYGTSSLSA